jgi:hypothetical protein
MEGGRGYEAEVVQSVIAGLDPAIHHFRKMDARVKPAHDDCGMLLQTERL